MKKEDQVGPNKKKTGLVFERSCWDVLEGIPKLRIELYIQRNLVIRSSIHWSQYLRDPWDIPGIPWDGTRQRYWSKSFSRVEIDQDHVD